MCSNPKSLGVTVTTLTIHEHGEVLVGFLRLISQMKKKPQGIPQSVRFEHTLLVWGEVMSLKPESLGVAVCHPCHP